MAGDLSRCCLPCALTYEIMGSSALVLTVWARGAMGWQAQSLQSTPVPPPKDIEPLMWHDHCFSLL